jgi:uncharacterized protein YegP (UPF0339 family)
MSLRVWSPVLTLVIALAVILPFAGGALGSPAPLPVLQKDKPDAGKLKFEVYQDKEKEFRWRLKNADGKILATAGQGYKSKESCKKGVELLKTEVGTTKLKFELYEDKAKEHRWRLKANNGQIVAASSDGYKTKADCEKAIEVIKQGVAKAEVEEKK